ncbi:Panacea domain-containing protein [[Haemophilus] ducreyi]|uniref:Panacea domain-containing protein n=1 Tax=Haemophilus ducreyi TaxID=730 RepID=UPI001AD7F4C0|nr:type II toxin-antitoxin system antitoxin SocA domain-containing protein [[Haemophilus] ducreyi]
MQFLLKKFLKRNKYINYFLSQCNSEENGDLISNLKIQKLVYYAQGFSLAINNKPLFSEKIQAWTHGPVTPELYNKMCIRDRVHTNKVKVMRFLMKN